MFSKAPLVITNRRNNSFGRNKIRSQSKECKQLTSHSTQNSACKKNN